MLHQERREDFLAAEGGLIQRVILRTGAQVGKGLPGSAGHAAAVQIVHPVVPHLLPGQIVLHSTNPAYPPVTLDLSGDCAEQFRVIGRVLWSGREYR